MPEAVDLMNGCGMRQHWITVLLVASVTSAGAMRYVVLDGEGKASVTGIREVIM